jgi:hypothetical protein
LFNKQSANHLAIARQTPKTAATKAFEEVLHFEPHKDKQLAGGNM